MLLLAILAGFVALMLMLYVLGRLLYLKDQEAQRANENLNRVLRQIWDRPGDGGP